nr:hypothetical protein RU989_pgp034 [Laurencia obtusa]WMP12977.1 hypothetical protein [Laurencia obtusa]
MKLKINNKIITEPDQHSTKSQNYIDTIGYKAKKVT